MLHSWRGEVVLEVFVSGQAAASTEKSFLDSHCIHIYLLGLLTFERMVLQRSGPQGFGLAAGNCLALLVTQLW